MTNSKDTLAALSEAATQGELEARVHATAPATSGGKALDRWKLNVQRGPLGSLDKPDAEFIAELWNAYRTGQLVPVPSVGWQPIDTAPKDGTTIDVWRDSGRETVYWGFPPHCCGEMGQHCDSDWHSLKEPGWICSTFGEYLGGKHNPFTHWMPLPDGPATAVIAALKEGRCDG